MNVVKARTALPLAVVLLGIFGSATGFAGTVDLTTTIGNFEAGNQSTGCPVGWVCVSGNGPTTYTVSSKQYTAGSDGLTTGIAPTGTTKAATCPYPYEGACAFAKYDFGTYAAGTTYQLTIWVGSPLKLPYDGTTTAGPVGEILFYWGSNLPTQSFQQYQNVSVVPAAYGKWTSYTLSFTPSAAQVGTPMSILIFVNGGANNLVTDFDFTGSTCVAGP